MKEHVVNEIETRIGYHFKKPALLIQAFTRKSYATENFNNIDNEILEFIGDKVLDYLIVKKMIRRFCYFKFEHMDTTKRMSIYEWRENQTETDLKWQLSDWFMSTQSENDLTKMKIKLVESKMLSQVIDRLQLQKYLIMGQGDIKQQVENEIHVKEDLYEALLGAIALDSDWNLEEIEKVIDLTLNPDYYFENGFEDENYVDEIQKWWQKRHPNTLPNYQVVEKDGLFSCELELNWDIDSICEEGKSKKEAIYNTARSAYHFLQTRKEFLEKISDLVDTPTKDNAINQLQELWQKGYIGKPMYDFEDCGIEWHCTCYLEGDDSFEITVLSEPTKKSAKKQAALTMLEHLINQKTTF